MDNIQIHNKGMTGIVRAKTTQNATDLPFRLASIPVGIAVTTVRTVKNNRLDNAASAVSALIPNCASAATALGSSMDLPSEINFSELVEVNQSGSWVFESGGALAEIFSVQI
ncbi:MAG: hypothetical protein HY847_00490 [Betaproteobacteria bacterium]|nr:hypothetical protein [Betaproteobacteria bacterium]